MYETALTVQLKPTENFFLPLDKLFRQVFNPAIKVSIRNVVECEKPEILTAYSLSVDSFNQFDKLVFCAAVSEKNAGNEVFTIRRLWRTMGGGHVLPAGMKEKIAESVKRLADSHIEIDMSPINNVHHYTDEREVIFRNSILPCSPTVLKINGQVDENGYLFTGKSPLISVAELKKQITKKPIELLAVPRIHNSATALKIKFYLFERITATLGSLKPHKKHFRGKKKGGGFYFKQAQELNPTILLDALFNQCELSDVNKWQKQDVRKTVAEVMNHFKAAQFIEDWKFEKGTGGVTRAVVFEPSKIAGIPPLKVE